MTSLNGTFQKTPPVGAVEEVLRRNVLLLGSVGGGGLVVSVLTFYSDNTSSNPAG